MSKKKLKSRVKELERKVSYLETVVMLMRASMKGEGDKGPPIDGLVVEELSVDLNIGNDPITDSALEMGRTLNKHKGQ